MQAQEELRSALQGCQQERDKAHEEVSGIQEQLAFAQNEAEVGLAVRLPGGSSASRQQGCCIIFCQSCNVSETSA